jgi:hypothetical protein
MLVPSAAGIMTGTPPCITDAAELDVPKSIPIIFAIITFLVPALSSPLRGEAR